MMRRLARGFATMRLHTRGVESSTSVSSSLESALEIDARRDVALEHARRHYDRIAPYYDLLGALFELRARAWRRALWERVGPGHVLELGVGTGRNLPFYPPGAEVTAIDISSGMLECARRRAARLGTRVTLHEADAQVLPYPEASFDSVVATFVFCTIPDPQRALREARRVLVPGGRILVLEHVLSRRPALRRTMRWLEPLTAHLCADHVDRETVELVRRVGFVDVVAQHRALDVVQQIEARTPVAGEVS
jgi:phosphatidylethanolamine/phosphatidyl-N-methylethanolamine N-methyltransferase